MHECGLSREISATPVMFIMTVALSTHVGLEATGAEDQGWGLVCSMQVEEKERGEVLERVGGWEEDGWWLALTQ